ncbi:MAG: histidinol dehydrogenase [Alphaproteobacteria bacterium GM202ARS2]|nr:histidinol dehydrogenase [Alphaproteobacteria bacterium GM202ARS2]
MTKRLHHHDPNFADSVHALVTERREQQHNVDGVVQDVIAAVRAQGDEALLHYTHKWDDVSLTLESLAVPQEACQQAWQSLTESQRGALKHAAKRVRAFHEKQRPNDQHDHDEHGITLGMRWQAIDSVGLYVPGGTAAYPSSVIMNAVPAQVAGVQRLVMVVPAPDGTINPLVLATAALLGIEEIYQVGGAQAIAALAYGTNTIAKVDKIVGPGNAYVTAAKKHVFGSCGIDMIAGPSEVLIVADASARADWLAIDLLAQAEHDTDAQSILITDNEQLAAEVSVAVAEYLKSLPRADIAAASWKNHGALIVVDDLYKQAPPIVDALAPEHLELAMNKPEAFMKTIRYAGAIFLGHHTPEAIGDYIGGPNHVLPTSRAARFSSGLSVYDFLVRNTYMQCNEKQLRQLADDAITLAQAEGLDAHARSLSVRINHNKP